MKDKEKIYEVLGELLYVVAKADGRIEIEEKEALSSLFVNHPWAAETIWSFDYEVRKNNDIESVYKKVINFCQDYGPAPEYNEFIEAMNKIAEAIHGVDENEKNVINSFSNDLIERFIKDTEILRKLK